MFTFLARLVAVEEQFEGTSAKGNQYKTCVAIFQQVNSTTNSTIALKCLNEKVDIVSQLNTELFYNVSFHIHSVKSAKDGRNFNDIVFLSAMPAEMAGVGMQPQAMPQMPQMPQMQPPVGGQPLPPQFQQVQPMNYVFANQMPPQQGFPYPQQVQPGTAGFYPPQGPASLAPFPPADEKDDLPF